MIILEHFAMLLNETVSFGVPYPDVSFIVNGSGSSPIAARFACRVMATYVRVNASFPVEKMSNAATPTCTFNQKILIATFGT